MTYKTIQVQLKNPIGKIINAMVRVRDGFAVFSSDDKNLAKDLYDSEKRKGNDKVFYNKEENVMVQRYPLLNTDEIIHKLKVELKKAGGKDFTVE